MRHLACISNGVTVFMLLTTGCVSSSAETAEKSRRLGVPEEQKTLRIAPPATREQAVRSKQNAGIAELMQRRASDDEFEHEVKMPAAVLGLKESDFSDDPALRARNERKMMRSDAEIAASFGGGELEKSLGDVDRSLSLSEEQQQSQRKPSYLTGTRQIKELFAARRFEDALVEVNELLLHFPKSSLLWTMKGTLHLRLRQQELSLSSYEKAFEFEPSNQLLAQIEDLRRRLNEQERLRRPVQPVDVNIPEANVAGEQK